MSEPFDRGERAGAYLEPLLTSAAAPPSGGLVATVGANGCGRLFGPVERALRAVEGPAVFTPPVYVGDALAGRDPAFGLAAVREFVRICLGCAPLGAIAPR